MKRLAFVAFVLASGSAYADVPGPEPDFGEKPIVHYESPQRFALEIKFTPYTPHIDRSRGLNGQTPFSDLFNPREYDKNGDLTGVGRQPGYKVLTTIEFDWQFLHRSWGTLGAGITAGFYRRTTHSFIYNVDAAGNISPCSLATCVRSGDQTGLNIMPFSALIEWRIDTFSRRWKVPLVPYFRGGLGYYVWWINDGGGFTSTAVYPRPSAADPKPSNQSTGYGGSFGIVLNPGIALELNWLERKASKTMDQELGINHIYLFCELNYAWVNGFGAKNKLDLSDTMLNAGLGFEF